MRKLLLLTAVLALAAPASHAAEVGLAVTLDAPDTFTQGRTIDIGGWAVAQAAGLPAVEASPGLPETNVDLIVDDAVVAHATTSADGRYAFEWLFGPGTASTHTIRTVVFRGLPVLETSSRTITTHIDRIITEISIVPSPASVSLGGNLGLRACALDDRGRAMDITEQATWATSDGTVATVSNADGSRGFVTGVAVGTATISASFEGTTGTVPVSVEEGPGSATIPCDTL